MKPELNNHLLSETEKMNYQKTIDSQTKTARLFNKFYLINDQKQGWNLRLHVQYAQDNGLGGEASPHYHRWTLDSKILTGGYCN